MKGLSRAASDPARNSCCVDCCCLLLLLLARAFQGYFDKLGEGIIKAAGKVDLYSSSCAPTDAPKTLPLRGWPGNCITWLGAASSSVSSTHLCTAIKSLPGSYIHQMVPGASDREQLLQFVAQEADLDIHVQVKGRLGLLATIQGVPPDIRMMPNCPNAMTACLQGF